MKLGKILAFIDGRAFSGYNRLFKIRWQYFLNFFIQTILSNFIHIFTWIGKLLFSTFKYPSELRTFFFLKFKPTNRTENLLKLNFILRLNFYLI